MIIKLWDAEKFYKKVVERYGEPNTSSLSKYYIEKHGFEIPPEVGEDSLSKYYANLPIPTIEDFEQLQSLVWYDLGKNSEQIPVDMVIRNKTKPSNRFMEKEIWVLFKRTK